MPKLDHLLWAAPDLDQGIAAFERLTGVRPAIGGSHPGFGTRNALASLSDGVYIEVIAPDPAQLLDGTLGAEIAALPEPRLFTFAVSTTDLGAARSWAEGSGFRTRHVSMSRTRPDGVELAWQILHVEGHPFGTAMPFMIQWDTPHHPSKGTPEGLVLERFRVRHPRHKELAELFETGGIPVEVEAGEAGFEARVGGPGGVVGL